MEENPMTCHPPAILRPWIVSFGLAWFAIGCAGGLPAVISSTPESVAVEFERDGSLQEAAELAKAECGKLGKRAEFDKVDITATPNSRIAKYRCVSTSELGGATE
jgi:hypothetical protein